MQDAKNAFRSLRKNPGFTLVAVGLLAAGIASNLSAFNLIDPLFLKPPHVDRPGEIVQISSADPDGRDRQLFSKILDPLRGNGLFRGVCGFDMPTLPSEIQGLIQSRETLAMTGDCFATLGIRTSMGRPLLVSDDDVAADRVVWLTDAVWRASFSGATDVLGQQILLRGTSYTIVGVTESGFPGLIPGFPTALIIPFAQVPSDTPPRGERPGTGFVSVLARMAPRIAREQVETQLRTTEMPLLEQSVPAFFNPTLRRAYLERRLTVRSGPVKSEMLLYGGLARRFETPLFALWGICSLVVLIACINLAILFLGRGIARRSELAVRMAIGADWKSIVRLLLCESLLVVLMGTALGVVLARWMNDSVARTAAEMFAVVLRPDNASPWLDSRSGLFLAVLVAVVASVLTIVPLWQGRRLARTDLLAGSGRGIVGASTRNQKVLLAAQLALTLASIAASGAFTASIQRLYSLDLGVDTRNVTVIALTPVPGVAPTKQNAPYYRDVLRQFEALPNVSSATVSTYAPLGGGTFLVPVSRADNPAEAELRTLTAVVGEKYFDTLGVSILAGEGFRATDREDGDAATDATAIVSQSLANRLGADQLIGRSILLGEPGSARPLRIVGIASDLQGNYGRLSQGPPLWVYMSVWQQPSVRAQYALVKMSNGTLTAADVRRVLASWGQHYPSEVRTLEASKDRALVEGRLLSTLSTGVSSLSLLLAATGLFGLVSYFVTSRTREIGIRMALGAERRHIHARVARELLPMMIAGLAAGIGLTFAFGKVAAGLVSGFATQAPWLVGLSLTILTVTVALAVLIPARRATSLDPTVALRQD